MFNFFKRRKSENPLKKVDLENNATTLRAKEPVETLPKQKSSNEFHEAQERKIRQVPEFNLGDIIDDKYTVEKVFRGGMGRVYITEPTSQGIRFAIKQPNEQMLSNKGFFGRIITEAEAWTSLGMHPHIAYCYFVKAIDNIPYIFIEYVEGGNLREWIADGKCIDIQSSLDKCIQFCHGMEHAHKKGMKHRDIKPENVLMTKEGRVKITDFGLAGKLEKITSREAAQNEGQTQMGDIMGTKAYMSPEQWVDPHNVDERADVFSFGVCMWEMLCGCRPYAISIGEAPLPPDLRKLRDDLPDNLINLLYQMIALRKEERQRDFTELREQLNILYKTLFQQDSPYYKIELPDTLADELNNRGFSYYQLGKIEKAIESWEEALNFDQLHFESNYNYSCLMWNRRWERGKMSGLDFVRKLEACKDSAGHRNDYWITLAWVYFEQGNIEAVEAIQASEHCVQDKKFLEALSDPDKPVGRLVKTFQIHTSTIRSVAISPDGLYAISGSTDLRLWEISTGKELMRFEGHTSTVHSIAFSPDCKYVLSGSQDCTIRIWDISSGKEVRRIEDLNGRINSLAISPDGMYVLSGCHIRALQLWEISTGKEVMRFERHNEEVNSVAISPDGRYALSGSKDRTLRLWDILTGKEVRRFEGHEGGINSVAISPDGRYVLSGCYYKTLRLWDISTGKEVRRFEGHTNAIFFVAFSPDGRFVLSGSAGIMILWETSSGKVVRNFNGQSSNLFPIAFSPDGRYLFSSSFDTNLQMWEIYYPKKDWSKEHPFPLLSVVKDVSKQNIEKNKAKALIKEAKAELQMNLYASAYEVLNQARNIPGYERNKEILGLLNNCGIDGGFARTGLNNSWCERILKEQTCVNSVAITPDGKYAFCGTMISTMTLWELTSGKEVRRIEGHTGYVETVAISPDGMKALSGSSDLLQLWEISTGKELIRMDGHTQVCSVDFSPNGIYIISGNRDGTLRLWESSTGKELMKFEGHTDYVISVAFSPDSKYAVSGSKDCTMRLWEISTGKEVRSFNGHTDFIWSVRFSPDGRSAISASWDKTLRLWDIFTGEELKRFEGHTEGVYSVAISPDGRYVISGSGDKTLRIWEISSGKEVINFIWHTDKVNTVVFSYDGRYALSGSEDATIRLWELDWDWELPEEKDNFIL